VDKRILVFYYLILSFQIGFGQSVDSLLIVFQSSTPREKIQVLLELSEVTRKDSFPLAFQYANEALGRAKKMNNLRLIASSFAEIGDVYQQLENCDSAVAYYRQSLKLVAEVDDPSFTNDVMTRIGLAFYNNDMQDSAIYYYKRVLERLKTQNQPVQLVKIYNTLTKAYYNQSDYKKVVELLLEKLKLVEQEQDSTEIASTCSYLSINKRKLGFYDDAITYNQKAIKLFESLKDSLGLAECYQGLGGIYYFMDNNEQAIRQFIKALQIYVRLNNIEKQAAINNNIGSVYNENGESEKALQYYKKALEIYSQQGNRMVEAIIADNIGLAYVGLNNYTKARVYFVQSLEMQKRIGNNEGIVHSLTNIAGLNHKQNNLEKAREQYLEALELAKKGNFLNEELNIFKELVDVEEGLGNYQEALQTMRNYLAIKDTIINEESRSQMNELEVKLNIQDQESKIVLLNKENELNLEKVEKQQIRTRFAIILVILLLVLLVIVVIALRFSREAKLKLEEMNLEISAQRNEIQVQNKRFTDSIQYAGRVQNALFTPIAKLSDYFSDYFLISKPFSIVSGDFYWFRSINGKLYLAVADCTGHGVPGAFMSMLGNAYLNEIVIHSPSSSANEILNELRDKIKTTLHQENMQGNTDGMDISLCIIHFDQQKLEFSGAYNPAYLLRGELINELKADKMPVAVSRNERSFTSQWIDIQKNDRLFLLSDGFYDQFGGKEVTKINRKGFKELLYAGSQLSFAGHGKMIEAFFNDWKGEREQTDDVMVLGCQF